MEGDISKKSNSLILVWGGGRRSDTSLDVFFAYLRVWGKFATIKKVRKRNGGDTYDI